MGDRLVDVEGIGPANAGTLAEHGVATTDDLLARGARPSDRSALAEATGIAPALILEWVNHADLFRIRGVAGQFADLLEEAGVDTVVELARRNPDNLAAALAETNAAKNLANRVPSATEVADWVAQANALPRAVFYEDAPSSGMAASEPAATPEPASEAAPSDTQMPAMATAEAATERPAADATVTPAPAPRAFAAPAAATDERGWLARLLDRIRGR